MTVMRQILSFALAIAFPLVAAAEPLKQEPPVPTLARGKTVYVDDGSCPAGQLKKVSGGQAAGMENRIRSCVSLDTMRTEEAAAAAVAAVGYKWRASIVLESGSKNLCGGDGQVYRQIVIKDSVFTGTSDTGAVWTLSTKKLKADGSGQLVGDLDKSGRKVLFNFDAGVGPRKIRVDFGNSCVWLWAPA
jgi:hypothetical protein